MLVSIVSVFGGGVLEDMYRGRRGVERKQKEQKAKAGQFFCELEVPVSRFNA